MANPEPSPATNLHAEHAAAHVSRNVATIAEAHQQAEEHVSRHQHFIERLTRLLGRPGVIYATSASIAMWTSANLALASLELPVLDPPPFFWLQSVAACMALLVTLMVLTTQNRQAHQAEKRSGLDLQINLLSEQKLAKLISLIEELRRDLPTVPNRYDPVAQSMTQAIDPRTVMLALEDSFETPDSPSQDALPEMLPTPVEPEP